MLLAEEKQQTVRARSEEMHRRVEIIGFRCAHRVGDLLGERTRIAARGGTAKGGRDGIDHPEGVWFNEAAREIVVWSEQYSFTLSLLVLAATPPPYWGGDGDDLEDTYDRFMRNR